MPRDATYFEICAVASSHQIISQCEPTLRDAGSRPRLVADRVPKGTCAAEKIVISHTALIGRLVDVVQAPLVDVDPEFEVVLAFAPTEVVLECVGVLSRIPYKKTRLPNR